MKIWRMVHKTKGTTSFFVIWAIFGPWPLNIPKNQHFEKMKKKHVEALSFLKKVTKIMIICYTVTKTWQATGVIIIIYSFWAIFCPFTPPPPLTAQKIKIKKNENKTPRDTIILHKCTKNHDHTLCFPEI